MRKISGILMGILLLGAALFAVPEEINFQGRLADEAGNPVEGPKAMALAIYDAASGGARVYHEDLGELVLSGGIYSFQFGKNGTSSLAGSGASPGIGAALASVDPLWLELSIDGVAQLPRQRLLAVPYSMRAGKAGQAERLSLQPGIGPLQAIEVVQTNGEVVRLTVPSKSGAVLLEDGTGVNAVAFRKAIGVSKPLVLSVADFGAVGDGVVDDTAAIQAAMADARTSSKPVVFEPGKRYRVTAGFNLDWPDVRLIGYGANLVCDSDNFSLFTLGKVGGATQRILIDGLSIFGTSSGDQVGIDCLDWTPKMITLRDCKIRDFGGSGLFTRHTDYLLIEKCHFAGNIGANWTGGMRTNVTTVLASAFSGQNKEGVSVTGRHIHAIDIDGLCMISSEFGDGDYGLYLDTAAGGFNTGITLRNCRTERVRVADAVLGTGAGAALPSNIAFEECTFMGSGEDIRDTFIIANWCQSARFRQCLGLQMAGGAVLVKALSTTATKLVIEDCFAHGGDGVNVFQPQYGPPTSARQIIYGSDISYGSNASMALSYSMAPVIKATGAAPCGVVAGKSRVTGVHLVGGKALGSTPTANWSFALKRFRDGADLGVMASGGTVDLPSWRAFTPLDLTLGSGLELEAGDVLVLEITRKGRVKALQGLVVTVVFEAE